MTDALTYQIQDDSREHKAESFAPGVFCLLHTTPLNADLAYIVCEYGCAWKVKWISDDRTRVTDPPRLEVVDYLIRVSSGWIMEARQVCTTSRDWHVNESDVWPIDLRDGQWRPRHWERSDKVHESSDERRYQPRVLYQQFT